jgi:competence protein ComEA
MKSASQIVLIAVTVASIAVAVFLIVRQTSPDGMEIILPVPTAERELELKVHVSGAVSSAGVYVLNEGDRVEQAIEAAGGATADADLTTVNLAIRVRDEGYYYIPRVGETPPPLSVQQVPDSGQIDVNTATADRPSELPGIGGVLSQAIVTHREENGPFSSVDGLLAVDGVGPAKLEAIRDKVQVR